MCWPGPKPGGKAALPAQWADLMTVVWLTLIGCAVGLWVLALIFRGWNRPVFTSVFQGGVRFNTFVGLAVADGLLGREGVAMTALAAGAMIVLINVLCVATLTLAVGGGGSLMTRLKVIPKELSRNPLILACLIGAVFTATGTTLPVAVDGVFKIFGDAGLPMALLAVGAGIRFGGEARAVGSEVLASAVQFIAKPLIAYALGTTFGLSGTALVVVVLLMALPTAPSAYILARQMGGDAPVMAPDHFGADGRGISDPAGDAVAAGADLTDQAPGSAGVAAGLADAIAVVGLIIMMQAEQTAENQRRKPDRQQGMGWHQSHQHHRQADG